MNNENSDVLVSIKFHDPEHQNYSVSISASPEMKETMDPTDLISPLIGVIASAAGFSNDDPEIRHDFIEAVSDTIAKKMIEANDLDISED